MRTESVTSRVLLTAHVGFGLIPSAQRIHTENILEVVAKSEMFLPNAVPNIDWEVELLLKLAGEELPFR